jgi:hypothetical protein
MTFSASSARALRIGLRFTLVAALGAAVTACAVEQAPVAGEQTGEQAGTTSEAYTGLDASIALVYTDTLERVPQAWEVSIWHQRITSGTATLASMRLAFVNTQECANKIISVYTGTLERTPATWEVNAWRTNLDVNGWSIKSMRHAFTQGTECGQKIVQVYQQTLNRTPATWEIDAWRTNLDINGWTIASMRAAFAKQAASGGPCGGKPTTGYPICLLNPQPTLGGTSCYDQQAVFVYACSLDQAVADAANIGPTGWTVQSGSCPPCMNNP